MATMKTDSPVNYVHEVPGHCDRVIWRGSYYHLENMRPAPETEAPPADPDHAELLQKIPRVGADFVAEIRELSRWALERRVLIQKDWLHSYSQCLDGLGLKIGLDKCRDPRDIRRIVEGLQGKTKAPRPGAWLIWYEDPDHKPEVFVGEGAEEAARRRFAQARDAWSCHLFQRIADSTAPDVSERRGDSNGLAGKAGHYWTCAKCHYLNDASIRHNRCGGCGEVQKGYADPKERIAP